MPDRSNGSARRRRVVFTVLGLAAATALSPLVVIQVGEWYRDIQEAVIFAQHLNGSLRQISYQSRLLRQRQQLIVYLPPSYGEPAARARRYPVLYLLHGCPGQPRDWLVKGDAHTAIERLIARGRAQEMILVMPDGSGPRGRFDCTLYMDNSTGAYPAEEAFVRELVPLIDRRFRTIPRREGRALLGLSSGGFAALNLGVRHPDRFGVLAALSGYFRAGDDPRSIRAVLGEHSELWADNSPADQIQKLPRDEQPRIYLEVGRTDLERDETEAFARRLEQLGIDHELRVTGGSHTWSHWRSRLPDALAWVGCHLTGPAGGRPEH